MASVHVVMPTAGMDGRRHGMTGDEPQMLEH